MSENVSGGGIFKRTLRVPGCADSVSIPGIRARHFIFTEEKDAQRRVISTEAQRRVISVSLIT